MIKVNSKLYMHSRANYKNYTFLSDPNHIKNYRAKLLEEGLIS
ncbi:hypothetical protein N499_1283 [Wolbachia pipientis wVitA]|nr:hypothetical protein N499_1283 [Wolbachia pipientis wVitA]